MLNLHRQAHRRRAVDPLSRRSVILHCRCDGLRGGDGRRISVRTGARGTVASRGEGVVRTVGCDGRMRCAANFGGEPILVPRYGREAAELNFMVGILAPCYGAFRIIFRYQLSELYL